MLKNDLLAYEDSGVELEGFSSYTTQEKRPLVLLCHAWKGRDGFICNKASQIAEMGYVGFALDMYGKGVLGKSKEENGALKKPFIEDRNLLRRRVLKGYEKGCSLPYVDSKRVAVVGFGFGAQCALDLARSGVPLQGAVSIYGHFDPLAGVQLHPIRSKILILHGFKDPVSPVSELIHFQQELDQAKVDWQTHLYGNTYHAFANPEANDPAAGILYNPTSAVHAWEETKGFLKQVFG